MPVPIDYRQASADFDRFIVDLRDAMDLGTTHQAWGALLGVLDTFRRRLTAAEGIAFAQALPPVLQATFLNGWHPTAPIPFADRATMDAEVMAYHRDHQLAPPGSIAITARTLASHVDAARFAAALDRLPDGARAFWTAP